MQQRPTDGAPFEPTWLDTVAACCRGLRAAHPRFEDLYLERRLEIRVAAGAELASCRSEGSAARWRLPSRWVLRAASGVSTATIARLVGSIADRFELPPSGPPRRPGPDPPPGWVDWARDLVELGRDPRLVVRFLVRQAVVVRGDGWRPIRTPPLFRLESGVDGGTALLAVADQPALGDWIRAALEPPPARTWAPEPGARMPVVFTAGTAGALLHELVAHLLEGDLIADDRSPLGGLGGAALTDAALDLVDSPGRFDLPGAFDCDDEGVPERPIHLIRGGRLCGLLCDRETGERCAVEPGRGRRADWRTPPQPRMSNLVVPAGGETPSAIEAGLDRGLVVTRLAGASVDPVSNRTVLRVERGFELAHGRRRRPLARLELTGGVTEILAAIDPAVGDDPTPDWRLGWCVKRGRPLATGSEVPTLLVRQLEVL